MSEKKREILFRGKENPSGKWIEGFLVGNCHIGDWVTATPVHSRTVGQFTGLTDKKGKKIFEGDILRLWSSYHEKHFFAGVVKYGMFNCSCCNGVYGWYLVGGDIRNIEEYEVYGNVHDNSELIPELFREEVYG